VRSETRIREMQQSGPSAQSCAFLERSLAAMLIQHAPHCCPARNRTILSFSGEAVSVIGYNVGVLLTVGSDCVEDGAAKAGGKEASSRKQGGVCLVMPGRVGFAS